MPVDEHHDYAQANRAHHDAPEHLKQHLQPVNTWISAQAAKSILKTVHFDKNHTTVLDFACGAGLVARELAPHAKRILGVDLSANMVNAFNDLNAQAGLDRENFHAVQRDELQNTQDELDGELFDVVFCAHAFHHVKDVKQLTLALSRRVKPGGCLLVIDHQMDHSLIEASSDPHMKEIDKVVAHKHGFKQQELEDLLRDSDQFESVKVEPSHAATMAELAALGGENNHATRMPAEVIMRWWIATGIRKAS